MKTEYKKGPLGFETSKQVKIIETSGWDTQSIWTTRIF